MSFYIDLFSVHSLWLYRFSFSFSTESTLADHLLIVFTPISTLTLYWVAISMAPVKGLKDPLFSLIWGAIGDPLLLLPPPPFSLVGEPSICGRLALKRRCPDSEI